MTVKTIDQLTDATTVALADELPIVQSGVTKRATVGEVKTALNIGANDYGTVANESVMVALSLATPGSTCYRTDTTSIWMLKVAPYSSAANWHNLGAATGVQNGLTPASTTLAPSVDAVNAALNPAVRSESSSFTITRTVHANRVTVCTSGSATDATWNIDATMVPGDYGRIIQTGAGAVTLVEGTGTVLYAPALGGAAATTGDGDWFDWECTGTNELTITACGKAVSGSVAADAIWTAKGQLAASTGANAATRLSASGNNGWTLQEDSTTATGFKFASPGSSPLTVIDLPSGSAVGASESNATLATVSIPGNTFTTGKVMEVTAFIEYTTSASPNIEILYGGTLMMQWAEAAQSYGFARGAILRVYFYAVSNSSQWSQNNQITTGYGGGDNLGINPSNSVLRTGAVDATSNQTLLLRITTGAGTTSVQCIGGKVTVL